MKTSRAKKSPVTLSPKPSSISVAMAAATGALALSLGFLPSLLHASGPAASIQNEKTLHPASPNEEHVVFFIQTARHDMTGHGDMDYDEEFAIEKLEKAFPHSLIYPVEADSNSELAQKLKMLVGAHTHVDGMLIMAHGTAHDTIAPFLPIISNDSERFEVRLSYPHEVRSAFDPVIGKFSPGARIIFNSCSLMSLGTIQEKLEVFRAVADGFGLKEGEIYMNSTRASNVFQSFFKEPIQSGGGALIQGTRVFAQLTAPLMAPMAYAIENLENRGYTYTRNSKGDSIRHDRFQRALDPADKR